MTAEVSVYKTHNTEFTLIIANAKDGSTYAVTVKSIPQYGAVVRVTDKVAIDIDGEARIAVVNTDAISGQLLCKLYLTIAYEPYTMVDGAITRHYLKGALHRDDDEPAVITATTQEWYRDGKRHRDGEPAYVCANGDRAWYRDGERWRPDDLPTLEYANGEKRWLTTDGKLHRIGGPALIEAKGKQSWYRDNMLHREDGPAVTYPDGSEMWYCDNKLHRSPSFDDKTGTSVDGPAYIDTASNTKRWHINGRRHREGALPAVIKGDKKKYYKDGVKITGEALVKLLSPAPTERAITIAIPGDLKNARVESVDGGFKLYFTV